MTPLKSFSRTGRTVAGSERTEAPVVRRLGAGLRPVGGGAVGSPDTGPGHASAHRRAHRAAAAYAPSAAGRGPLATPDGDAPRAGRAAHGGGCVGSQRGARCRG